MCNYCECENYELCSIVGNIPLGFCCPKCAHYNGEHTCLHSKMKTEQSITAKKEKIQALRSIFKPKDKLTHKDLENFP